MVKALRVYSWGNGRRRLLNRAVLMRRYRGVSRPKYIDR
jgi:hypothetical protein